MNFEYRANESAASLREVGLPVCASLMSELATAYDSVSSDEFEQMAGETSNFLTAQVINGLDAKQVPTVMVAFSIIESVV